MSDFGFYEDAEENQSEKEVEGITNKVTGFAYTGLSYPCVIFRDGFSCPKHKMTVISHMVKPPVHKSVRENTSEDSVGLYFKQNSELYKMGALKGMQMGAFLDLVGTESVEGFYDEVTPLSGDHLYALCSA